MAVIVGEDPSMPFVLAGTDLFPDFCPQIDELYNRVMRAHGFDINVVRPMSKTPSRIELVAQSGGKIDAIVLHDHSDVFLVIPPLSNPFEVARSIRLMGGSVTFRGAVRARCVPIVVVIAELVKNRLLTRPSHDLRWLEILSNDAFERRPESLVAAVVAAVTGWRQSLLQELDYVGYTVTVSSSGDFQVSHALTRTRREGEILANEATPGSLRMGQYLILSQDLLQEFEPYRKLQYLLNHYREIAGKLRCKPESVFQKFFEEHPHIIRRDLFDAHWAQPSLRVPGAEESLRPDFVLRPRVSTERGTRWQILDLKLPDDALVASGRFHATLSTKLVRAIQQLQDYRDYFNRADSEEELVRHFGSHPLNPRLAVLIGRRDRIEDPELLDKVQGPRYLDIDILTYDEIVDLEASRLAMHSTLAHVF